MTRIGKVDYLIHMYDRRKKKRVFHINMLKQWFIPTDTGYMADDIATDPNDDVIPVWKENGEGGSSQAHIANRLNVAEQTQLLDLLKEFDSMRVSFRTVQV